MTVYSGCAAWVEAGSLGPQDGKIIGGGGLIGWGLTNLATRSRRDVIRDHDT